MIDTVALKILVILFSNSTIIFHLFRLNYISTNRLNTHIHTHTHKHINNHFFIVCVCVCLCVVFVSDTAQLIDSFYLYIISQNIFHFFFLVGVFLVSLAHRELSKKKKKLLIFNCGDDKYIGNDTMRKSKYFNKKLSYILFIRLTRNCQMRQRRITHRPSEHQSYHKKSMR